MYTREKERGGVGEGGGVYLLLDLFQRAFNRRGRLFKWAFIKNVKLWRGRLFERGVYSKKYSMFQNHYCHQSPSSYFIFFGEV